MAWNPSPEVAAARDAAKKLDNAPIAIVFYVTRRGEAGYASYGESRRLCEEAGKMADALYKAWMNYGSDE